MSRWQIWRIWISRAMLAAVLLLATQYLLGRATRSKLIESGELAVGARVELTHARVSLASRQVAVRGVRVADPRRPLNNLVEADRCELDLAAGPLLYKRAVVERGIVTGLRFGTRRETSGELPVSRGAELAQPIQWANDEAKQKVDEWLDQLRRRFDPKLINQLEQIQRTAELVERVPADAAALEARVEELARRAEGLQAKVNSALANPLRHAEFLKTVAVELPALQREFAAAAEKLDRLPDAIDQDRRSIVASRRQDEARLREQFKLSQADADAIASYLLEKQLTAPLNELVAWLRLARQMMPATATLAKPKGQRGEDILFAGSDRAPGLLVRELTLLGSTRVAGRTVDFRGTLTDLASTPAFHDRPLRVKLTATGTAPMVLQATVDRTGAVARDELLIDCERLPLPQAELGESDRLWLVLAPSTSALSVSVSIIGEELSGDIQLVQKHVSIAPTLGDDLGNVPIATALQDTLGDVGALATRVSLSGTLATPKCRLWSNLGSAVAEAMERALEKSVDQHTQRMLTDAKRKVDERLTNLERHVAERDKRLRQHLDQAARRLDEIVAAQKPPQRITTEHVGRRLPANSLFR